LLFCFSPEADAHFREMSAHVNKYFQKIGNLRFFGAFLYTCIK